MSLTGLAGGGAGAGGGGGGAPDPHAASHENGGTDEISVAGLSGVLADAQTPAAHVHAGADITSGTVAVARLPDATISAKGIVELATDGESAANLVPQANDARLSNARTPTAHAASHYSGGSDPLAGAIDATSITASGEIKTTGGVLTVEFAGNEKVATSALSLRLASDVQIQFFNATDIGSGAADAGLKRSAAGVVEATNGGAGAGAFKAGNLKLAANTLSSEDANGHVNITPNGTGETRVNGTVLRFGAGMETASNYIRFGNVGTSGPLFGGNGGEANTGARLASTGEVCWSSGNPTATRASNDLGASRAAAGVLSVDTTATGNGLGVVKFGSGVCRGLTSSAGAASTTEYPNSGDWGLHKNTTDGVTSLVRNDGGAIKAVALA